MTRRNFLYKISQNYNTYFWHITIHQIIGSNPPGQKYVKNDRLLNSIPSELSEGIHVLVWRYIVIGTRSSIR